MRPCIYCGKEKSDDAFSDEHIWPDALGGDHLPDLWRTNDVCRSCNSMSGVFVDGAFIRSWFGSAEQNTGARDYLDVNRPAKAVLPLQFLAHMPDKIGGDGYVTDYWVGPCGAYIIHFRSPDSEDTWEIYAGGDPRRRHKRKTAGRAYLALTSKEEF